MLSTRSQVCSSFRLQAAAKKPAKAGTTNTGELLRACSTSAQRAARKYTLSDVKSPTATVGRSAPWIRDQQRTPTRGLRHAKEYFDLIDRRGAGTNIIHLVPHGPVRCEGMDNANRPPTAEELRRMEDLVERAMRQGAWGLSTGLIYDRSCYADTEHCKDQNSFAVREFFV